MTVGDGVATLWKRTHREELCHRLSQQPLKPGVTWASWLLWKALLWGVEKLDACGDEAWREAVLAATCPWTLPWKVASL